MTTRRLSLFLFAGTLAFLLIGCDAVGGNDDETIVATAGVYVANQGNFGDGNGSVTVFNPQTAQSQPTAIQGLNSTVQGIAAADTSLLVMANSAARIDVFSPDGPTQTAQLTSLSGPRYAAVANDNTAYVTDQSFSGPSAVKVLDLSGSRPQVTERINVSGLPEGITSTDSRVYAALGAFGDTTLVAAIDRAQNALAEEIDVGCTPRALASDAEDEVFVLCSNSAEAVLLDGETGTVQSRLSLPDTAETANNVGYPAAHSSAAQELYVATDTGILRIDTEANTVSTTIDVDGSASIGAVGYDGLREELYVARVPGYTEQGTVTVHNRDGEQTGSFSAGIAPTYIEIRQVEQ